MRRVPGQSLAEYALFVFLILVVCIAVVLVFGGGEIFGALGMIK